MLRAENPIDYLREAGTRIQFGIQGGKGSFNESALLEYVEYHDLTDYDIHYLYTSENVLDALRKDKIHIGQVALYNMAGGFVDETTEAMKHLECRVVGGFSIRISHALMIRPDIDFSEIYTIMSHPQVFAQCKGKLSQKYPQLTQTTSDKELIDSAMIADQISQGKLAKQIAVMGNPLLAKQYGLKIIEENLQDHPNNYTSFLHLAKIDKA